MFTGGLTSSSPNGVTCMSKYLFDNFSEVNERIKKSEKIALFLDYDGTLVDFKKDAMKALPSEDVKHLLNVLIKNPKINVFIITGRNRDHIEKLLPMEGLEYICSHGFEMDFPDFNLDVGDDDKKTISEIFDRVKMEFSDKITDMNMKGEIGINFNYRPYNGDHEEIKRRFVKIVKKYDSNNKFRIMKLSKAFNVIPKMWDKGKAVEFILERHVPKNTLSIYFGDDVTDEDAFGVLKGKGITVYVKNDDTRGTNAQFFVNDPDETLQALKELFNFL